MPALTAHFTTEELGLERTPLPYQPNVRRLAYLLEELRAIAGGPLIVTSVWRSPAENAAAGGVSDSRHLTGEAGDFLPPGGPMTFLERFQAARAAGRAPAWGEMEIDPQDGHVHVTLARLGARNGEIVLALGGGEYQTLEPGKRAVTAGAVLLVVLLTVGLALGWFRPGGRFYG